MGKIRMLRSRVNVHGFMMENSREETAFSAMRARYEARQRHINLHEFEIRHSGRYFLCLSSSLCLSF